MAKRGKRVLKARRDARDDDALLVRSAESLGRVIGSLQRQVQASSKTAAAMADDAIGALPELPRFDGLFGGASPARRKRASTPKAAGRTTTAARKKGTRKGTATANTSRSRKRSGTRKSAKKR